ncbi:poly polymerase catalytic domain-domain-containing protein [Coniella lustricola]|uniref:Poly [ADP-ribose] polymerase n=1 Tax=Coniella lustricola TaxID=2025994 RepID=A0A2T3A1Q2_9PEZI|nr:poly polymerase catalytic domain-domain-containing protein [Coniella lustricola]
MPRATRASKAAASKASSKAADTAACPVDSAGTLVPDASKKRAASVDSTEPDTKKTKLEDEGPAESFGTAQIAKDRAALDIPLDEGCSLSAYSVYIDSDDLIWDASLNQTHAGNNHNKFYRLQLLVDSRGKDFKTWSRWGRVGERGQSAILGDGSLDDAKSMFEKKFKDKSGLKWENRTDPPKPKKYAYVERSYEPDEDRNDDKQTANDIMPSVVSPCTLEPAVKRLVELIFDPHMFAATMSDMRYDNEKLPLGKLSKATILRGFEALKEISNMIANPNTASHGAVEDFSNLYYSLIPHVFGRDRPPVLRTETMLKREIELLETLTDLKDAINIMKAELGERNSAHPLDRQYYGLNMAEMTPLDPNQEEFKHLARYLNDTRGSTHDVTYDIEDIFRIERQGEKDRFDQSQFGASIRDRRLLWHGSRATNFGGILSQGLRIAPPEAPVSGYMFGKGVYLADMSSKSAGYCYPNISRNTALLLLCEAELGKPMYERDHGDSNGRANAAANGSWSTLGRGGTMPPQWKDAACVHPSLKGVMMPATEKKLPGPTNGSHGLLYNEYICYDVAQIRLRYLFRIRM